MTSGCGVCVECLGVWVFEMCGGRFAKRASVHSRFTVRGSCTKVEQQVAGQSEMKRAKT
jgi:hypothetical protein